MIIPQQPALCIPMATCISSWCAASSRCAGRAQVRRATLELLGGLGEAAVSGAVAAIPMDNGGLWGAMGGYGGLPRRLAPRGAANCCCTAC